MAFDGTPMAIDGTSMRGLWFVAEADAARRDHLNGNMPGDYGFNSEHRFNGIVRT